jgi:hypothetical protein
MDTSQGFVVVPGATVGALVLDTLSIYVSGIRVACRRVILSFHFRLLWKDIISVIITGDEWCSYLSKSRDGPLTLGNVPTAAAYPVLLIRA